MQFTKAQKIAMLVGGVVVLFFILIFTGIIPGLISTKPPVIGQQKVTIWGIYDDELALRDSLGPEYPFEYYKIPIDSYEDTLVNALAEGRGPDIFMIHHEWVDKHREKIAPLTSKNFTESNVRDTFPGVVADDFIRDGSIYGLPLSIDTLALFYNRDYFDNAGISTAPRTWQSLVEKIPALRVLRSDGGLERAAIAIGGSKKSINRATDILSALMLQAGVAMTDENFRGASFSNQGSDPFRYYLSFANAGNVARYTWKDDFFYSINAFTDGKAAAMFHYSYELPTLKNQNPFSPVAVAPFPQVAGATVDINYANYWGYAVSKQSQKYGDAWNLIGALTLDPERAKKYFEMTKRPPALRSIIAETLNDPDVGIFARQALTARSWRQIDPALTDSALSGAISDVLTGFSSPDEALQKAEAAVTRRMQGR